MRARDNQNTLEGIGLGGGIPHTTAILFALRRAFTTFWTCAAGSADGTRKCGVCGKGDVASRGR